VATISVLPGVNKSINREVCQLLWRSLCQSTSELENAEPRLIRVFSVAEGLQIAGCQFWSAMAEGQKHCSQFCLHHKAVGIALGIDFNCLEPLIQWYCRISGVNVSFPNVPMT